jgi:5-methylcytosine-specific restriction enzyme subunit McrC
VDAEPVSSPEVDPIHWTEHGIPIRNLWYLLLYAWNETPLTNLGNMEGIENAPTLDALLASLLVRLVEQRLRTGLGRDYTPEKQILSSIRGRIDFTGSLKGQAFERGQAACEFEPFSLDVPKNQIIRSTLVRLVQTGQLGPESAGAAAALRRRLRRLTRAMEGVSLIELKPGFIRRLQMGRGDRDYQVMLAICELIYLRQMPAGSAGHHRLPDLDRAALVMSSIYERFVANFYRAHLVGWAVTPQKMLRWHERAPNKYLPFMIPDLLLQEKSSGRIILLDTKFTAQSLVKNRWGREGFVSSHLYQLYAYLKTQEHISKVHRQASGILLYPTVGQYNLSEKIDLQDLSLRIESVDLTAPWPDIERNLLDIILTHL